MTNQTFLPPLSLDEFALATTARSRRGARLVGLFARSIDLGTRLVAVFAEGSLLVAEQTTLSLPGRYPSLVSESPAAHWYEREIHDLFELRSTDRTLLNPLVFAFAADARRPLLGSGQRTPATSVDLSAPPLHLRGEGVFTISYGPVRSGVFESIEYIVETPGEDIPHLSTRISYKHRGVESTFEGLGVEDGVLVAERCEGVASVAHALSFCGAVEEIGGVAISPQAGYIRVVHAELERVANHLDSTVRHTEAAGQAVAFARFSLHKERVQRLRARLCGSRFGRGVVVPGGVRGSLELGADETRSALAALVSDIHDDTRLLMNTPSFLDRLRGTGVLSERVAQEYGALGPVGRGSGQEEDVRCSRPYAAYAGLQPLSSQIHVEGDALSRQRVRIAEIDAAFSLIEESLAQLDRLGEPRDGRFAEPIGRLDGEAVGWAEAPQGEVVTWVVVRDGELVRVKPRSASFHNLALFPMAFPKDILTDFAFIEASFGLSIAGAAS